ncbi:delta-aminolevulinic acid dehydratase isoform X2 [Hydra vulgaris]|uniref:Delta-aminolevulinic acid dehydratase n=1 Tax=Hydra vulgaris TaxID=6087 RepID=A0ABM4BCP8_HYDVU
MSHCILQGGYFNNTLRSWQSNTSGLTAASLIYPIFISYEHDAYDEIKSLPGQFRVGKNKVVDYLKPLIENGLKTVLLFGMVKEDHKNEKGDAIYIEGYNPVINVIKLLKETFHGLLIACDVCLCAYTDHGHCGILDNKAAIDNKASVNAIALASLIYATAGCHIIAPSDMMDGRIYKIDQLLKENSLRNKVTIMSYSAKFASCFYGPFRDAAASAPAFGDRRCYQLPPQSAGLANRSVSRDVSEGADILMVKPGMAYLDVVKEIKNKYPDYPVAVYQVSGEYAMLYHASQQGAFDIKQAVMESLHCMMRAGATVLISYFTPQVLKWLKE